MAIPVVVLLISTLASVGLVALWAATSPRPLPMRAAALTATIAPLAFVPAVEPLAALALEAAAVAGGATMWRRATGRPPGHDHASPPAVRFSIASLLAAMTLTAIGLALVINAESLNDAWQSLAVIGLGGAGAVLLGAWPGSLHGVKGWLAAAAALGLSYSIAAGVARADWFAPSMMYRGIGWPPSAEKLALAGFLTAGPDLAHWMWYAILPAVTATAYAVVRLARIAQTFAHTQSAAGRRIFRIAAGFATAVSLAVVLPAATALFKLLTPDAISVVAVPQPNALDDFMVAAKKVGQVSWALGVNFYNFSPYHMTRDDLAGALTQIAPALRQIHQGLAKPCLLPIDYRNPQPLSDEYFGHMHCVRQALLAEARLAELEGELDRSLAVRLDLFEFGHDCRRGGLLKHNDAGAKGVAEGVFAVQQIRDRLSRAQCLAAVARIEALEAAAEPLAAFIRRERVWQHHAHGWHGRLYALLSSLGDQRARINQQQSFLTEQAKTRLFKAHLWLRAYLSEHDDLPDSWRQAMDAGLPPLPVDPWDPAGGPLRYRRQGKSYLLYSIGPNGIDDGGARPASATFYGLQRGGDYHIDLFGRD